MKVTSIFGPPGTGKTCTMVDFIQDGGGVFLSYTKAAAAEALSRLPESRVVPSTMHSYCYRAMNMTTAQVVDKVKLAQFAKATGIPFQGSEPGSDEPQEGDDFLAVHQYARNKQIKADDAYEYFGRPGTFERFRMFVDTYAEWKRTFGYMDFDDMLLGFLKISRALRIPRLFIDEAQDCTVLQWRVINHICKIASPGEVFLAGDDDQAIYEWSGADPHGMATFTDRHEGTTMILAQSYRVPRAVQAVALPIIQKVERRVEKTWGPRAVDGKVTRWGDVGTVVDNVRNLAPEGAMILVRDRFKLQEVTKMLNQDLVPYDVQGGFSPWTSAIAKKLRKGEKDVEIPPVWGHFYSVADLSLPVLYHVSTIHQAKGREHDTVIMDLDCPTRVLHNTSLDPDPEHRVQYVGMTRAKRNLFMCGNNPVVDQ